jgi:hypothetical protein
MIVLNNPEGLIIMAKTEINPAERLNVGLSYASAISETTLEAIQDLTGKKEDVQGGPIVILDLLKADFKAANLDIDDLPLIDSVMPDGYQGNSTNFDKYSMEVGGRKTTRYVSWDIADNTPWGKHTITMMEACNTVKNGGICNVTEIDALKGFKTRLDARLELWRNRRNTNRGVVSTALKLYQQMRDIKALGKGKLAIDYIYEVDENGKPVSVAKAVACIFFRDPDSMHTTNAKYASLSITQVNAFDLHLAEYGPLQGGAKPISAGGDPYTAISASAKKEPTTAEGEVSVSPSSKPDEIFKALNTIWNYLDVKDNQTTINRRLANPVHGQADRFTLCEWKSLLDNLVTPGMMQEWDNFNAEKASNPQTTPTPQPAPKPAPTTNNPDARTLAARLNATRQRMAGK